MTTHVYETMPANSGEKPRCFEFRQNTKDAPLTHHPETGEPIRRVVLGGFDVLSSEASGADSGSSRGPGCGCH